MDGENQRPRSGGNGESGVAIFQVERVTLLVGREVGAVDKDALVNEVETPIPGALEDARHVGAGLLRFFVGARKDLGDHLGECAQQPVAGAGGDEPARGDAAAHGALFSIFWGRNLRWIHTRLIGGSRLRTRSGRLRVGLGYVGVIDLLLLFLECFFLGEFLRGGLCAGGEQFPQRAG